MMTIQGIWKLAIIRWHDKKRFITGVILFPIVVIALFGGLYWYTIYVPIDGEIKVEASKRVKTDSVKVRVQNTSVRSPNIYIGEKFYALTQGVGEIELNLSEGRNHFEFALSPREGRKSEVVSRVSVIKDTTGPRMSYFLQNSVLKPWEEVYNLTAGSAQGALYGGSVSFPITGNIGEGIKYVKLAGKTVSMRPDRSVNTRMNLFVRLGDNIFDVEAMDDLGNVSYDTISITWEETGQSEMSDIQDKLDDINSKLE